MLSSPSLPPLPHHGDVTPQRRCLSRHTARDPPPVVSHAQPGMARPHVTRPTAGRQVAPPCGHGRNYNQPRRHSMAADSARARPSPPLRRRCCRLTPLDGGLLCVCEDVEPQAGAAAGAGAAEEHIQRGRQTVGVSAGSPVALWRSQRHTPSANDVPPLNTRHTEPPRQSIQTRTASQLHTDGPSDPHGLTTTHAHRRTFRPARPHNYTCTQTDLQTRTASQLHTDGPSDPHGLTTTHRRTFRPARPHNCTQTDLQTRTASQLHTDGPSDPHGLTTTHRRTTNKGRVGPCGCIIT